MEKKGFYTVQSWMLDMPLSLVETVIYAVIYGFSQDGETTYRGSLSYLSRKAKVSKDTARRALVKLTEGGYIQKIERTFGGVTFNDYRILQGGIANCNPIIKKKIKLIILSQIRRTRVLFRHPFQRLQHTAGKEATAYRQRHSLHSTNPTDGW